MIELTFPWPSKELSPNWRGHWSKKAKAAKKYKDDCLWRCKADRNWRERWLYEKPENPKGNLALTFNPPSKRRMDIDNMFASCKNLIDAISTFTGIDDSKFTYTISKAEPVKNGAVRVVIS